MHKIEIYQRVAAADSDEELAELFDELIDRFGEPPAPVINLLAIARLKFLSKKIGVSSLTERGEQLEFQFVGDFKSRGLLKLLRIFKNRIQLLTANNLLRVRLVENKRLDTAMKVLEILSDHEKK
mgnify:CR=1 FL=1